MRSSIDRRLALLTKANENPDSHPVIVEHCARDPVAFIQDWVWTFDPRAGPDEPKAIPFDLWPKQREYVLFFGEMERKKSEFVVEKSRDVGMSWLTCVLFVHRFLFVNDWKGMLIANKEANVDIPGDIDSLFEKMRFVMRNLPKFLLPTRFNWRLHSRHMHLKNPNKGSAVVGRIGENAGRGGRATCVVLDEAAHIPRAHLVDRAISAVAQTIGWVSSVNGEGNTFAQKRNRGTIPVFRLHYSDDPRKDAAWVRKMKAEKDKVLWAQEYEIDYGASVEGIVITNETVRAAVTLRRRLLHDPPETFVNVEDARRCKEIALRMKDATGVAGVDVGGQGKAESVFVVKRGGLIDSPVVWKQADTIEVANLVLEEAVKAKVDLINYDEVGVGQGVTAAFVRRRSKSIRVCGVNTGVPPTDMVWSDGRTSDMVFSNLKAELWNRAREAFRRSWELLAWLDDEEGGVLHSPIDCVLLANDDVLIRQLSTPTQRHTERGLRQIESKAELRTRGVASPDRADALVLAFHIPQKPLFYIGRR